MSGMRRGGDEEERWCKVRPQGVETVRREVETDDVNKRLKSPPLQSKWEEERERFEGFPHDCMEEYEPEFVS